MAEIGDDDGGSWPVCENVLRSLSEDIRPIKRTDNDSRDDDDPDAAVAANVRSCLQAERVAPTSVTTELLDRRRLLLQWRRPSGRRRDEKTVAAARRTQIRCMAVRSTWMDGEYYGPEGTFVSRTVEELQPPWTDEEPRPPWTDEEPRPPWTDGPPRVHVYTVGTVLYDGDTGACHLHGFADPRTRVAVDCVRLTDVLPRHRSTVKMYSELRMTARDRGTSSVTLVPYHFQVFSCGRLFR